LTVQQGGLPSILSFHRPSVWLPDLSDKDFCGHFQKLAGIHTSKPLKLLQFSPYVPLGLAGKGCINHPFVQPLLVERVLQAEDLT
jgi:hypothetical protein